MARVQFHPSDVPACLQPCQLNRQETEPLNRQLFHILAKLLKTKRFLPFASMPANYVLARHFKVDEKVVRQAYRSLHAHGLLLREGTEYNHRYFAAGTSKDKYAQPEGFALALQVACNNLVVSAKNLNLGLPDLIRAIQTRFHQQERD